MEQLADLAEQLVEEIQTQRDLTYAESGDLEPEWRTVNVPRLLRRLQAGYTRHPVAVGRTIALPEAWEGEIVTDPRLLHRVLGNMLKNALEATASGGLITLRCIEQGRASCSASTTTP